MLAIVKCALGVDKNHCMLLVVLGKLDTFECLQKRQRPNLKNERGVACTPKHFSPHHSGIAPAALTRAIIISTSLGEPEDIK